MLEEKENKDSREGAIRRNRTRDEELGGHNDGDFLDLPSAVEASIQGARVEEQCDSRSHNSAQSSRIYPYIQAHTNSI